MKELVDHIFELVQNSIKAHASSIYIGAFEEAAFNRLRMVVEDDGKGIRKEDISKVMDPFYSRSNPARKRVGMGLSLFYQDCRLAGGDMKISSVQGQGTRVEGVMQYDHIDRQPLGDLASLFSNLFLQTDKVSWTIEHRKYPKGYRRTLQGIKTELCIGDITTKSSRSALRLYLTRLEHGLNAE